MPVKDSPSRAHVDQPWCFYPNAGPSEYKLLDVRATGETSPTTPATGNITNARSLHLLHWHVACLTCHLWVQIMAPLQPWSRRDPPSRSLAQTSPRLS